MIIGFHIPKQKTFLETVQQIPELCDRNINCAQIFTSSPKNFDITKIDPEDAKETRKYLEKHDYPLFVHGKYVINLASPKPVMHHIYSEQLKNSAKIGAEGCIVHMGKSTTQTLDQALDNMENNLKKAFKKAPEGTIILETSTGAGTEMLSKIPDLRAFLKRFTTTQRNKFRFCIDTCHIFAAGYDIRTSDKAFEFLKMWKKNIGFKRLAVIHLNDSLGDLGSRVDRHAPIGQGKIGMEGLVFFSKFAKKNKIPLILERGSSVCCQEIKELKSNVK